MIVDKALGLRGQGFLVTGIIILGLLQFYCKARGIHGTLGIASSWYSR